MSGSTAHQRSAGAARLRILPVSRGPAPRVVPRISRGRITMSLAIETHQLTRFFDQFCAVDSIELRVERGTFYGFLGPNGAGKSTTIKMLTGLLAPSSGEMRVLGMNVLDQSEALEAKRHIGVIPE